MPLVVHLPLNHRGQPPPEQPRPRKLRPKLPELPHPLNSNSARPRPLRVARLRRCKAVEQDDAAK